MLVLGIKTDETIYVGEHISVMLCLAKDGKARLGFTAPADVQIQREKVRERVRVAAEQGRLHELEDELDSEEN